MCEKSVAQSETGPVTIGLRVPTSTSARGSRNSRGKRSSTVMSGLLQQVDRAFRAVGSGEPRFLLLAVRHDAGAEDLPEALVVVPEQVGRKVVAAAVALAATGVYLQFHRAVPIFEVAPVRARPATIRASSAAHSSSSTACRSGVISALPIASSRQKCARALGDRPASISLPAWATRMRSLSQSARSPT